MSQFPKYKCRLPSCPNKYYSSSSKANKKFFTFPKLFDQRKKWFAFMNSGLATKNKIEYCDTKIYLCEDHFTEDCFTSTLKTRLHKFAVPSLLTNVSNVEEPIIPRTSFAVKNDNFQECRKSPELLINPAPASPEMVNILQVKAVHSRKRKCVSSLLSNHVKRSKLSILRNIRCKKSELTPSQKQMYYTYRKRSAQIYKLKKNILNSKNRLKSIICQRHLILIQLNKVCKHQMQTV